MDLPALITMLDGAAYALPNLQFMPHRSFGLDLSSDQTRSIRPIIA